MNFDALLLVVTPTSSISAGISGAAQQFFTLDSFATFAGASVVVVVLTKVFVLLASKTPPPWVAFVLSLAVAFYGAYATHQFEQDDRLTKVVLAFLNGCLLFTSAAGLHETVMAAANGPGPLVGGEKHDRPVAPAVNPFLKSWFKRL